ncbi:MAG: iron-sulfur cluster assembly accessory protein [Alphaproteobacteria bacterium]|nr:iron-sulfur cluster assembly accessory protein [Alphaproteobacteria bacterium]
MSPVITLTPRAAERIKYLIAQAAIGQPIDGQGNNHKVDHHADTSADRAGKIAAIRVLLANRGCSGKSYEVEYADAPKQHEEIIEDKGVKIYIDPAAVMFLLGTEMDWVEEKFSSSFQFNNPNEKARCGCGESFMV